MQSDKPPDNVAIKGAMRKSGLQQSELRSSLVKIKVRVTSPYFMGEVRSDEMIDREVRITALSGVLEATRSER